jgi:Zn-dependent oligopeptidase
METPENINEFLDLLSNKINGKAENDFNKLREFKKQLNNQKNPLMQWDIPYLSSKYKKSKYEF